MLDFAKLKQVLTGHQDIKKGLDFINQQIKEGIKKQPLLMVGGCFALGFVIGRVITKK